MSLLVSSADASAYRSRLKRTSLAGKRRYPLLDADQRFDFLEKLKVISTQNDEDATNSLAVLTPVDPELPGDGQHFCVFCSRHFITAAVLGEHERSKTHKKRCKEVEAEKGKPDQSINSELAVGFTRETKKFRVSED